MNDTGQKQDTGASERSAAQFEQALVNRIAREFLLEQRRSRRWNIAFRLFFGLLLLLFLLAYFSGKADISPGGSGDEKHTALIDIQGLISSFEEASADHVASGLRAAYEDPGTAGIIIRINSPGGSPVQAGYINDEIRRLKSEHPELPVYAVISDVCASGGYYIASAADEIYADKASLVGSIGVVAAGFGFVDAINKLGIERRVRHAGEHKAFMDPFSPQREEDLKHVDLILDDIYQQFIQVVKEGRGDRLADDDKIFSGLVWTGEQSIELGLTDGLGSAAYVARELINAEEIVDFTYRESWIDQFMEQASVLFSDPFGKGMNQTIYNIK